MKLSKSNTKCLQGIAILFMLGLHLFNRSDILVLCQDLVQVKMRFSSS